MLNINDHSRLHKSNDNLWPKIRSFVGLVPPVPTALLYHDNRDLFDVIGDLLLG